MLEQLLCYCKLWGEVIGVDGSTAFIKLQQLFPWLSENAININWIGRVGSHIPTS